MGQLDWRVVGMEQTINQLRNVALGFLFVEIAQERAMRSAGTLASAMLDVEGALIRAHYAALQWGQTTIEQVTNSQVFQDVSANVEDLVKQLGALKSAQMEAATKFGDISGAAQFAQARVDMFIQLHPGLEQREAMIEQARLLQVQNLQTQLHLAVSQLMLRENIRIAQIAEALLEVQLVQSSVMIGAALGGGIGPSEIAGALIGLSVGGAAAGAAQLAFQSQTDQMVSTADKLLTMSDNLDTTSQNFDGLNASIKDLTQTMRDFGKSQDLNPAPHHISGTSTWHHTATGISSG